MGSEVTAGTRVGVRVGVGGEGRVIRPNVNPIPAITRAMAVSNTMRNNLSDFMCFMGQEACSGIPIYLLAFLSVTLLRLATEYTSSKT